MLSEIKMAETSQNNQPTDIGQQQLGAIYAKAFLATAGSDAPALLDEFDSLIHDCLNQMPDLDQVLSSVRVPDHGKIHILDSAFANRMSDRLLTFLKVVARHGRLDCLRAICTEARHQYNRGCGMVEIRVTTSTSINSDLQQQIISQLRNRLQSEVAVDFTTDQKIIGGLQVRVGDKIFDGSVANRLKQFRQNTLNVLQDMLSGTENYIEN